MKELKGRAMNTRLSCNLAVVLIILTGILFFHSPTHADIIFQGDYETGNFSQRPRGSWTALCCGHSEIIVSSPSPVRAGKYAARFELRYNDPSPGSGKRAEIIYHGDERIGKIGGPDEWYGFSIYLPTDYEFDSASEIVAQWHAVDNDGSRNPPWAILTSRGNWNIITKFSSNYITRWQSPYETGVWVDWVFHFKWSYQSDGFAEVWKDSKKILDYKGPTIFKDEENIYFQWGIYKWPWNNNQPTDVTKRVVYNDELRIGDSNSSYAEVAPRAPDTTPPSAPTLSTTAVAIYPQK